MHRLFFASTCSLIASVSFGFSDGVTLEQFLTQNDIHPSEPSYVRLVRADLPVGCERKTLEGFVEKNRDGWSSLQQDDLDLGRASSDGYMTLKLALKGGRPSESTVHLDSTDSIALMERIQADFSRIRFPKPCGGPAEIELRFHLQTEARLLPTP